jgi:hypothetical protein
MSPHPDGPGHAPGAIAPAAAEARPAARARPRTKAGSALALFLCLGAGAGCRARMVPVLNVVDAPVASPDWAASPGAPIAARPQGMVRVAILRALAARTWTVDEERVGVVLATVQDPPHYGQIAVTYSDTAYSINYRGSSPSLQWDGQVIHRRYNEWVDDLHEAIDDQLKATQPAIAAPVPPVAAPPEAPPGSAAGGWPPPARSAAPVPVPAVPPRAAPGNQPPRAW